MKISNFKNMQFDILKSNSKNCIYLERKLILMEISWIHLTPFMTATKNKDLMVEAARA
jgi:hypothetical protein